MNLLNKDYKWYKAAIKAHGLSQVFVSKGIGYSIDHLNRMLNGRSVLTEKAKRLILLFLKIEFTTK